MNLRNWLRSAPRDALDSLCEAPPQLHVFAEQPGFAAIATEPHVVAAVLTDVEAKFAKTARVLNYRFAIGDGTATSWFPPEAETASPVNDFRVEKRRVLSTAFHPKHWQRYLANAARAAATHAAHWQDGQIVNVYDELTEIALEVMVTSLFQTELKPEYLEACQAMRTSAEAVYQQSRLDNEENLVFDRGKPAGATGCSRNILQQRRQAIEAAVETLLTSKFAGAENPVSLLFQSRSAAAGKRFSDEQIRNALAGLFSAGYENVATVASWTLWFLARNPTWQQSVVDELRSVLSRDGLEMWTLPHLRLLTACTNEAMRIYSPVWSTAREAVEDVRIGDHDIPKGAVIILSPWVLQRSSHWWSRPLEFLPERFLSSTQPQPGTFFPFGLGGRGCLGRQTASITILSVVAEMLRTCSFSSEQDQPTPTPMFSITQRPFPGLFLRVHRRRSAESGALP
jgi:cytochrome P450